MKTFKIVIANKNVVQHNVETTSNGDVEALLAFWTYDVRWKVTGKPAKVNKPIVKATAKSETHSKTQERPRAGVQSTENLK